MLNVKSYAKINLTLEVIRELPNGYHQLSSVMQMIDLSDQLVFKASHETTVNCSDQSISTSDNLVFKAVSLLRNHSHCEDGIEINIEKNIPVSSGLGGGSSNAAVTLETLCSLWDLKIEAGKLLSLASELGSDVPFFLRGPLALVEGTGEKVNPMPKLQTTALVLLIPNIYVGNKTANMYKSLTEEDYTNGEISRTFVKQVRAGKLPDENTLFNTFETKAFQKFPALHECKKGMLNAGASSVHLSGSGPVLYTFTESDEKAKNLTHVLNSRGFRAIASYTI